MLIENGYKCTNQRRRHIILICVMYMHIVFLLCPLSGKMHYFMINTLPYCYPIAEIINPY